MEAINGNNKYEICTFVQKVSELCLYDFSGLMSNLFSPLNYFPSRLIHHFAFFFGIEEKKSAKTRSRKEAEEA